MDMEKLLKEFISQLYPSGYYATLTGGPSLIGLTPLTAYLGLVNGSHSREHVNHSVPLTVKVKPLITISGDL